MRAFQDLLYRGALILDTGPLIALGDVDDDDHQRCVKWFDERDRSRPMVMPVMVMGEVAFHLGTRCGPAVEASFFRDLADGRLAAAIHPPDSGELDRIAELVTTYADMPLGATDASVIAAAERFNCAEIATLDHRHFTVVRPRHVSYFTLLP